MTQPKIRNSTGTLQNSSSLVGLPRGAASVPNLFPAPLTVYITSSQTYIPSAAAGYTRMRVTVCGGGGGGYNGGGGGGGTSQSAVMAPAPVICVVGASAPANNPGNTSTATIGSIFLSANGGAVANDTAASPGGTATGGANNWTGTNGTAGNGGGSGGPGGGGGSGNPNGGGVGGSQSASDSNTAACGGGGYLQPGGSHVNAASDAGTVPAPAGGPQPGTNYINGSGLSGGKGGDFGGGGGGGGGSSNGGAGGKGGIIIELWG